ncbi:uridine kinase [Flavobacterium phragmitis]|nr:uridine kinase [Flavobacterium phragmitis]
MSNNFKVIVFVKIALLFLFSSAYNDALFQPFLKAFIDNKFVNPWQFYFEHNLNLDSFPYHSFMLLVLTPFSYLSALLNIGMIFKMPLFLADLGILYLLLKFFPSKSNRVYIFYFLNPIVIYSIYIHAQLDIIPTALLLYSIYLLTLNKNRYSAIILGLALATKFHIIIALPLILFYLHKTNKILEIYKYFAISLSVFLFLDLPFLFSEGFMQMVLLNPKQSLIFNSFYHIGAVKILLPIASILLVYFHFYNQNKINHDLLYFYFGLLFTAVIFFIYPGPAWYVWMIPFVAIYFVQNKNKEKSLLLYSAFSLTYLIFFLFFHKSEYADVLFLGRVINLKIENENMANIAFTFLEVILAAIIYAFYKYGIKSNSIYNKHLNLVIGIGGDSGVGKTTLVNNLQSILGDKLLQIEGDGEHKWERGDENWKKFTHLDPKANHIHKQSDAIYGLKHNQTIYRCEYEHSSGKFTEPKKVLPKEFIVIAGLHPFYLPKLRKNIDLKIYIDTDETLRRHWKIIRDIKKRGYSHEKIIEQIENRMTDAEKYIYPQKEFADMVINYFSINEYTIGQEGEAINLGLKITFDANIPIEDILNNLDCSFEWDYNYDLKTQFIKLNEVPNTSFEKVAFQCIENLDEIVSYNCKWEFGYEGFIQLLTLKMISEQLKLENR